MKLPPWRHVRTRLTVRYVAVLGTVLMMFMAAASVLLYFQFRDELDHFAIQDIETVEGLLYFTPDGQLRLNEEYHNHPESRRVLERLVEVRSPSGAVLFRNERLDGRELGGPVFPGEGDGGYSPRSVRLNDGSHVRMVSRRHNIGPAPVIVRLGYTEDDIWRNMKQIAAAFLLVLPLTLALAGFAGYGLARRALAPLEVMTRQAEAITPDRLHERLPVESDDELGQLARVFNQTLGRLEKAFEQLRRFTSDASHELRTPLASMRGVGEAVLQRDAGAEEYREAVGSMLEEVNRLSRLVDGLLALSRADAGTVEFHATDFPVMELVQDATSLLHVLMEEKSQRLTVAGDASPMVHGDRIFLRQAFLNIMHNAVKFSPPAGEIAVTVAGEGEDVLLEVRDDGPGIPPEHAGKVFDRFYRADPARSRQSGGAGLGLAIAQWAVRSSGGSIELVAGARRGATFRIRLPRATR